MPTNREDLLKAANLVKPALAANSYVPALTHLCFDEHGVTASSDVHSLFVGVDSDLNCCLPGELFLKAMSSFQSKDVKLSTPDKDGAVKLVSGRNNIKIATMAVADYPFHWPEYSGADVITFSDDMLKGMQECLISVGTNANHPAQMGVTIDQHAGRALFFSTDTFSVSRYESSSKIDLPAQEPLLLPTFFCEQLLALSKAYKEETLKLYLLERALLLVVGKEVAMLHTKMLIDAQPLAFPDVIKKHLGSVDTLSKNAQDIPPGWEEALQRSLLILATSMDKEVVMSAETDGEVRVEAKSEYGEQADYLKWNDKMPGVVTLNPQLVLRGSAHCSRMMFTKTTLAMCDRDASFIHMVAYSAKVR